MRMTKHDAVDEQKLLPGIYSGLQEVASVKKANLDFHSDDLFWNGTIFLQLRMIARE